MIHSSAGYQNDSGTDHKDCIDYVEDCCTDATCGWKLSTTLVHDFNTTTYIFCNILIIFYSCWIVIIINCYFNTTCKNIISNWSCCLFKIICLCSIKTLNSCFTCFDSYSCFSCFCYTINTIRNLNNRNFVSTSCCIIKFEFCTY